MNIKQYPHGLDEEWLPRQYESEQRMIKRFEPLIEQASVERKPSPFKGLGKSQYAAGCFAYALGNPIAEVKTLLPKGLENLYTSFSFGIPMQAYEFIKLLSLAIVTGNADIAQSLSETQRARYTNENVEVEEITFTVAELLSAFVRKNTSAIEKILEDVPDESEINKIFRFDRMLYFPLIRLLDAVYKKDAAKFAAAMQMREKEFVSFYKRSDVKNAPEALIDMPGLAITVIARNYRIEMTDKSVYRPAELI